MANGRGGRRPGAGRKRGSAWQSAAPALRAAVREKVIAIVAGGGDPITFLSNVVQDETVELSVRLQAAAIVLPYIAPRQSYAVVAHAQTGAVAHLFSAEEPDRLRGPNLDGAWCDELCTWPDAALAWDMLAMALRIPGSRGDVPKVVVSTTPKPSRTLKEIMSAPSTVITRARTADNAANLDASTLVYLREKYGGTTLGRQELDAELLEDADGALWSRALIDASRVAVAPDLRRVVVAVDPSGTRRGDEAGIVDAGVAGDGHGYVLADLSLKASPETWARKAVQAYQTHQADRIVAEANFGAEMVAATIRSVDPRVPVKLVHASRGKAVRAEPVVALYEQRRIHHVGVLSALEDELCQWGPAGNMPSPGRLDALVWAITELVSTTHQPVQWVKNVALLAR